MRVTILTLCFALMGVWRATAQELDVMVGPSADCIEFNQNIVTKLDSGKLVEVEVSLFEALKRNESDFGPACLALMIHNMANVLALSGRLAEAEVLAERTLKLLDKFTSVNDPIRFRPLHLLWSTQIQRGERGRARQTFEKMRALRLVKLQDRAMFHGSAASEMQVDGRYEEAEREYLRALAVSEEAGRGETGDYAILLCGLGTIQFFQSRYPDAGTTLERALAVANSAKDTVPMDLIRILSMRAALKASQTKWQAAAEDYKAAISIADRNARLDPGELKVLLGNLGQVLRNAHRGKEAGSIEARAKAISSVLLTDAIIDVSELSKGNAAKGMQD